MSKNSPIRTFVFQLMKALLAAVTVILLSRWMGPEGRGELGLLLFYVNLIMIANEYMGGSSLANLASRFQLSQLLPITWLWAIITCGVGSAILYFYSGNIETVFQTLIMALPLAFLTIHFNIYQGRAEVFKRNWLQVLLEFLKLLLVIVLAYFHTIIRTNGPQIKLTDISTILIPASASLAYSAATFFILLLTIIFWAPKLAIHLSQWQWQRPPKELIGFGFWAQNGQLVQFLNYRLNLVILTTLTGTTIAAGVYSNALLIADTIWIFANSFAVIAHMRILQSSNQKFKADITIRYAVIAIIGTVLASLVLLLIPQAVFISVFGSGFFELKSTAVCLIPGIIALGASTMFSHYLHAVNKFKALLMANAAGLLLQTTLAYLLIPQMGLVGACIAADAGFILILLIVLVLFFRENKKASIHGHFSFKAILKVLLRN